MCWFSNDSFFIFFKEIDFTRTSSRVGNVTTIFDDDNDDDHHHDGDHNDDHNDDDSRGNAVIVINDFFGLKIVLSLPLYMGIFFTAGSI